MVNEGKLSVAHTMDLYPEMSYTDNKGKTQTERANKYFIMLGKEGDAKGTSLAERRLVGDHIANLLILKKNYQSTVCQCFPL